VKKSKSKNEGMDSERFDHCLGPVSTSSFTFGVAPTTTAFTTPTVTFAAPATTTTTTTTQPNEPKPKPTPTQPTTQVVSSSKVSETHTTKMLLLVALCYKQGYITGHEKGKLKDLIISGNELVSAATVHTNSNSFTSSLVELKI
jgi:hypothetical protein